MDIRKLGLFVLIVLVLAALGALAPSWLPSLLNFAGSNNDVIGGLSGLVQLALWAIAALLFLVGLLRSRKPTQANEPQGREPGAVTASGDRSIAGRDNMSGTFITSNQNSVTDTQNRADRSDKSEP